VTETPPDWVLIEAAKRSGWGDNGIQTSAYTGNSVFRALCDMILKYEQPPVDRKLLCAREAIARSEDVSDMVQAHWREGRNDNVPVLQWAVHAIELWEEGFGK
jgi:hypothetical protein